MKTVIKKGNEVLAEVKPSGNPEIKGELADLMYKSSVLRHRLEYAMNELEQRTNKTVFAKITEEISKIGEIE